MFCRSAVLSVVLVFLAAALPAGDFRLVFASGRVESMEDETWKELADGDVVPGDRPVRVGEGTTAEFACASGTVLLSRPGVFRLALAAARNDAADSRGFLSLLGRVLSGVVRKQERLREAMGVRAKRAGPEETFDFVDENTSLLQAAAAAYRRGDYREAASILENEIDPETVEDKTHYRHFLAASHYAGGRKGPALQTLPDGEADASSPAYGDYLLLRGMLLSESGDFPAADSFARYVEAAGSDADRQMGLFLMGQACIRMGDDAKAGILLQEAVKIGADAEITRLAGEMLK